jgi:UDP-N-acetylglucosamine 2-epimerase (non-hydrolysing)
LVNKFKLNIDVKICVTGQHRQMLDQVLKVFNITPDYDLNLMTANQSLSELSSRLLISAALT